MENVKIKKFQPSKSLNIHVPGSKSMTNRALIMAAMAEGTSRLFGVLASDDSQHCLHCLQKLGVDVTYIDATTIELTSPGIENLQASETLYIGSAGTTARFLPGLLATSRSGYTYIIDASEQLKVRPIKPLLEKLEQIGMEVSYLDIDYSLPFQIIGKSMAGGEIEMSGDVSSQFISGLLMAAPYFTNGLKIVMTTPIVQAQYVQMTIEMMKQFGVDVEFDENYTQFHVAPQKGYQACTYTIEPDVSTAGYFFALGLLFNTQVCVEVSRNTLQPDIELLDILDKLGARIEWAGNKVFITNDGTIKGNQHFNLTACSDQALTVGVISAFADGPVELSGIGHIRHHESDRLYVLHDNLRKLGIKSILRADGITIYPGQVRQDVLLPTHDDHRVAMAFSLIGLKIGNITIEDADCTKKTFPGYFEYLKTLGAEIE